MVTHPCLRNKGQDHCQHYVNGGSCCDCGLKSQANDHTGTTIQEAVGNALLFLESLGYRGGDIHDDLKLALDKLVEDYPEVGEEEL